MKRLLGIVLLATGCVRTDARFVGNAPNGAPRFYVTCNRDIGHCYERATATCPRGYDVEALGGQSRPVPIGQMQTNCVGYGNSAQCTTTPPPTVQVFDGSLVVVCR